MKTAKIMSKPNRDTLYEYISSIFATIQPLWKILIGIWLESQTQIYKRIEWDKLKV